MGEALELEEFNCGPLQLAKRPLSRLVLLMDRIARVWRRVDVVQDEAGNAPEARSHEGEEDGQSN